MGEKNMKTKHNLEEQYQFYLKKVKLKESEMGQIQQQEMRRTFMAACGQMFVLLTDDMVRALPVIDSITDMSNQVHAFFLGESAKMN